MSGFTFANPTCRGSVALGTACGKCEKCKIEMSSGVTPIAFENDRPMPGAKQIISGVRDLVKACHEASYSAGWWHFKGTTDLREMLRNPATDADKFYGGAIFGQKIALSHTELSEAVEGHRKNLMDDKLPHRPMAEVELADAVIRICDLAGAMGYDLGGAIAEKLAYNATRADHKPENRAKDGGKAY